jgi:ribose 5-phosphate isomerase B
MTIYIGADHRGFALKEKIKEALKNAGREVVDLGSAELTPGDDYPDIAGAVARKVSAASADGAHGDDARGIVICGSGFGVDIVANKFNGVRSALAMSADHIRAGRHDDDVNVLSLAADFITPEKAIEIVEVFLATPFENTEHYLHRLAKIADIEKGK